MAGFMDDTVERVWTRDPLLWTATGFMAGALGLGLSNRRWKVSPVRWSVPPLFLLGVIGLVLQLLRRRSPMRDVPGEHPVGNAIYDPRYQTRRRDIPQDEQVATGPAFRGTLPSLQQDSSNQPHTHESPF